MEFPRQRNSVNQTDGQLEKCHLDYRVSFGWEDENKHWSALRGAKGCEGALFGSGCWVCLWVLSLTPILLSLPSSLISASRHLPIHLSIHPPTHHPSIHSFTHSPNHPPIYPPIHPSIIHPPTMWDVSCFPWLSKTLRTQQKRKDVKPRTLGLWYTEASESPGVLADKLALRPPALKNRWEIGHSQFHLAEGAGVKDGTGVVSAHRGHVSLASAALRV